MGLHTPIGLRSNGTCKRAGAFFGRGPAIQVSIHILLPVRLSFREAAIASPDQSLYLMKPYVLFLLLWSSLLPWGQAQPPAGKKQLSIDDLVRWKTIEDPLISPDGRFVAWRQHPEEGDDTLGLWDATTGTRQFFARGDRAAFSADSRWFAFRLVPPADSVRAWKRRKLPQKQWPKDTLALLDLHSGELRRIPGLKRFALPRKYAGWLALWYEPDSRADTTRNASPKKKKESRTHGSRLELHALGTDRVIQLDYVTDWVLAEEAPVLLYHTSGDDSLLLPGLYLFDLRSSEPRPLWRTQPEKAEFASLTLDPQGRAAAFLLHLDTANAEVKPWTLALYRQGQDSAAIIADTASAFLPQGWQLNPEKKLRFSKAGHRLLFGIGRVPPQQDTSLLEDEIVHVEVWTWKDPMIYPQQNVRKERELKRAYEVLYQLDEARFVVVADTTVPEVRFTPELSGRWAVGWNEWPYLHRISWEGFPPAKDIYRIDLESGARQLVARAVRANVHISPGGTYALWYQVTDTAWYACALAEGRVRRLTHNGLSAFYDELNDRPMHPRPYGVAGWTEGDERVLIYDRYDLWALDPAGKASPRRLTKGREDQVRYRVVDLDAERHFLDAPMLLHLFDEKSKGSGYAWLSPKDELPRIALFDEHFWFGTRVHKARQADRILFTKENYQLFPDLQYAGLDFAQARRVSHANPQQQTFRWGTIELVEWTSLDGQKLQGLLVKPEDFDPDKQYPLLVNFYERNSHTLHRHRRPHAHRSTINYPLYVSKGYLIFNPDIPYKVGYPGQSCYDAVMSGVRMLIDKGFVDKSRIGVQGHSWGGYQVAYLLTRTGLFRCAEAGAPVVNMFSAYGGIRWGSGLSRMFQYERTQSRIGGTIWEYPLRYLENSPLFFLDRVTTPVLILHNDQDGAVPWYQGIEYYIGLRRLGKPAWLLNYNGEPHWPLKLQNRKDFQTRMAQFFDHYLLGAPMPQWMERGVPAWEKGIRQGLQLQRKKQ